MKLITYNINSVRARLENLLDLISNHNPDIVCLQEIKCMNDEFPYDFISDIGYNTVVRGQKGYCGVAVLSKYPIQKISDILPGDNVNQARYLEVITNNVHLINIYAPNGNPIDDSFKFPYKIDWTKLLVDYVENLLKKGDFFIVAGDYNIAPKDEDCYNPVNFKDNSITQPEIRSEWERMKNIGMKDVLRDMYEKVMFTFWDYKHLAFLKNNGLRIDHVLIPEKFSDCIKSICVDIEARKMLKASDHAPVIFEFDHNN